MNQNKHNIKGFTLIELLIVIAVMAILTSVVFVALNPLARFQDARNNRRRTDVNAILSAIKLHQVDNGGIYDDVIKDATTTTYMITNDEGADPDCDLPAASLSDPPCSAYLIENFDGCLGLDYLVGAGYIADIPYDPNHESDDVTYYYLHKYSNGTIEVGACDPEQGSNSSVPAISIKQ